MTLKSPKTKVRVIGCRNGVTEVTEVTGIREGKPLFVYGEDRGAPGDSIEVDQWEIEESWGTLAMQYYYHPTDDPQLLPEDESCES